MESECGSIINLCEAGLRLLREGRGLVVRAASAEELPNEGLCYNV